MIARALIFISIVLTSCGQSYHVYNVTESTDYVDRTVLADEQIDAYIAPFRAQLQDQMSEVIGQVESTMIKSKTDPRLGHWMADAMKAFAQMSLDKEVHFALQNYGGIRVNSVSAGPLTVGQVYELMPFENLMVIVELDQKTTMKMLEKVAASGGWPVSDGLEMTVRDGKPQDVLILGKPLSEHEVIRIVLPDYVANGGDGTDFLGESPRIETGVLIRDVLIQYAKQITQSGDQIVGEPEPRIKVL